MSANVPLIELPSVAPNTIVPTNEDLFNPYFIQLYEEIAFAVNAKDFNFYPIPITSTASNIPNVANFGSFIIAISGTTSGMPTLTVSCVKADSSVAGTVNVIGSQAGTIAPWVAATLTVSSTATNFQINHSVAGVTGSFNIRIVGTQ
jgi:hypothetical protein